MYIVTPYPNILYALDLTKPGAPMKWKFEPNRRRRPRRCLLRRRQPRRGFADGRIFFNTLDDHTVAVDAETGKEVWNTKLGDINIGETITMAPLVVKDKVLVGNSRRRVSACAAGSRRSMPSDGKVVWTAYSTGPDSDVLIGPDFKPFYDEDKGKDLGVTTWPPDAWKIGGGTMWGWISYDPELNLIYLRHRQSRPVESRPAPGRQQMDGRHLRARRRYRRRRAGSIN